MTKKSERSDPGNGAYLRMVRALDGRPVEFHVDVAVEEGPAIRRLRRRARALEARLQRSTKDVALLVSYADARAALQSASEEAYFDQGYRLGFIEGRAARERDRGKAVAVRRSIMHTAAEAGAPADVVALAVLETGIALVVDALAAGAKALPLPRPTRHREK